MCALLGLAACAGAPPVEEPPPTPVHELVPADPGQFGERPDIPTPEEIHRLDPEQRAAFLRFIKDPIRSTTPRHRRVFEYLQRITQDFHFRGDTLMAADAIAQGSGNCLSLAIVTTALARLANVEVGYQLADDDPVFEFNGNVVKKGVHVRSTLYEPDAPAQTGSFLLRRPSITIDYFPTSRGRFIRNLDEGGYLAMYYRNIAADAIEREDYRTAYWYVLESLAFAPDNSEGLNMLAVVYGRVGDFDKAEQIYVHGLERADEKLSLLKNYRSLLLRLDRHEEAREIERQLARIDDPSPYHWFQLARSAYENGEYTLAIDYYRRALEIAPYLHEGYLGLAQAYYQAGRMDRAADALKQALENAERPSTRSLYQAKLQALAAETLNN
ncbi:MAG TPA: tetratricopeptide repeat protein [Woeseiaceae bacterium]|nr:tetratricopeptide repeat protein [Woeseiaceae bacterium]